MSTINGIPNTIGLIQPISGLMDINLQNNSTQAIQAKQALMPEDEIDKLINAQIQHPPASANVVPQQINPVPPVTQAPIEEPDEPSVPDTPPQTDEPESISFNLDAMNTNLDSITTDAKNRIKGLVHKQGTLNNRINLMEKFILLDEKDLAVELAKKEPNFARITGLRKSLVNQTELLSQIMDILLKFEDSVHKWYKTLMDIEKDKVSAFQKVKSITKETTTMDGDINDVLGQINKFIHTNPTIANEAQGILNMSGYGGKPFNQ